MTRFAPRPSKRNSWRSARRRLFLELLEDRRVLAASPYQNAANPYDVNVDGVVNGADV